MSTSISQAQQKFQKKCLDDYELNVSTRLINKTLWIYLPTKDPLFDYSAESPKGDTADKKLAKYDLRYLDGAFKDLAFNFEYDIIDKTKSDLTNYGIRNDATPKFTKMYNNLFMAMTETLFNTPETSTMFVVAVITDITKGIEVRYTFYLEDYRRSSVDALPFEEFSKRILQESKGSTEFIGDEIGQHLEYTEVLMPDFLVKQIINRIRLKFTQSDFPPGDDYENTIIDIIANTTRTYEFKDFKEVRTEDLRTKKKMIFTIQQLSAFGEDKQADKDLAPKGKLIHITFDNGKTTIKE